jgi:uncharacterized protein YdaU (DUF1376 family)
MSPAQRGGYWQLICWQMQSDDGHLPDDVNQLTSLSDIDLAANKCVLDAFPVQENGKRANNRALREWIKRAELSGTRSKAAAIRWEKDSNSNADAHANADANASDVHTQPQPQPQPQSHQQKQPHNENSNGMSRWQAMLDKYRALGVDVDREKAKAEAWLLTPRGRSRKMTERFFASWLSRAASDCAPVASFGGHDDPENDPLLKHAVNK